MVHRQKHMAPKTSFAKTSYGTKGLKDKTSCRTKSPTDRSHRTSYGTNVPLFVSYIMHTGAGVIRVNGHRKTFHILKYRLIEGRFNAHWKLFHVLKYRLRILTVIWI